MPVPTPIAIATVSPFAMTGSHALPTSSNSFPRMAIVPAMMIAAAETSAIIITAAPKFFAREVSLGDSPVLTVVSRVPMVLETVVIAVVAFPRLEIPFSLENTSRATTRPPMTSTALIIIVTLSTPLQSPCLMASQFADSSRMIPVNP